MKQEDIGVKIPALLHLTRLGYGYLTGKEAGRDRETNILTERLREGIERINGVKLVEETFQRLMEDLKGLLRERDLGLGFYRTIREGWNGLRLLDFAHPKRNEFLTGTEIACGTGKQRFRPDITLFINGLPLGMMEVKAPGQKGGLKGEYERMCRRFRQETFRPYLQAAQIWMFSNDRENRGLALLPRDGAFFTGGAPEIFPVYPGPEKRIKRPKELGRLDRAAARMLMKENGLTELRKKTEGPTGPDPGTPTHRMLTGLAAPERFLFLIRYGILYEKGPWDEKEEGVRKRMLNWDQLEALRAAEEKIRRGYRNWKIPCSGKKGRLAQGAELIGLLRDRMPESEIYWVAEDGTEARRAETSFRRLGMAEDKVRCLTAEEIPEKGPAGSGRSIYILPEPGTDYRTEMPAARRMRAADPEAIIILMGEEIRNEGTYYIYLLECADGSLYCGWTNNLEERVRTHNAGQGAKYTRSRLPARLVYWESYDTKREAMSREWHVKQMARKDKMELIRGRRTEKEEKDG